MGKARTRTNQPRTTEALTPTLPEVPPFPRPGEASSETAFPPTLWIHQPTQWEYRLIRRELTTEQLLTERELNELGAEGWELAAILPCGAFANYYFKRSA